MRSVRRFRDACLFTALLLLILIALLSIAKAQTNQPKPDGLTATWISKTAAVVSWRQRSNANYTCLWQIHPSGGKRLFDCWSVSSAPGSRSVRIPFTHTQQEDRPLVGDEYSISEYFFTPSGPTIDYGESDRVQLLFRVRLIMIFKP